METLGLAATQDVRYTCGRQAKLRWQELGGGPFYETTLQNSPVWAPHVPSVAVASQHRAQHCWNLVWSSLKSIYW